MGECFRFQEEHGAVLWWFVRVSSFPQARSKKAFCGDEPERRVCMDRDMFVVGSRVRVVSYSPFRGLRGTIQTVHGLPPIEEPVYFYRIALEGTYVKEAIWFSAEEVELLSFPESLVSQESML
jgi:hypothetical protein